jgi:uncharacterized integral membrane protein
MAIARMFVPLLILAGLALFALQNSSPVLPLVVFGVRTQALPLSVWMLGAIGAGAATTIAVSSLFSLSKFTAVRRSNKNRPAVGAPPRERVEGRPWTTWNRNVPPARPAEAQTRIQDEWERPPREEWDDWDEQPSGQVGRDRLDDDWDNWEGYTEPQDRSRPPVRTDFEAKQEPVDQKQSGSIYSYSYNKPDQAPRKDSVYDADYRVVVPPEANVPELDEEDWGFDDEDETIGDRPPKKS